MREWIFITLYGALFLIGLFLFPFWAMLANKRRKRVAGRWTLRSDRYFVLATAIAVLSLGDTMEFGGRTWGNLTFGLSPILLNGFDAIAIGCGLAVVFVAKLMLVWLADLEKEPPVWTWTRWLAIVTAGWGFVTLLVEIAR